MHVAIFYGTQKDHFYTNFVIYKLQYVYHTKFSGVIVIALYD